MARTRGFAERLGMSLLCLPLAALCQTDTGGVTALPEAVAVQSAAMHVREPVTYVLDAADGQSYLLEIEQQGLDYTISVATPDGSTLRFDSPLRRDENEFVLLDRPAAGRYVVTIDSAELTTAEGSHSIVFRNATAYSFTELQAWRLMSTAAAANAQADLAIRSSATALYSDAAQIWHALGNRRREAQCIYSAAMLEYWVGSDWSASAELARSAAQIYAELNEPALVGSLKFLEATALIEQAGTLSGADAARAFARAETLFAESYALHEPLGDTYELAHILNNQGLTSFFQGRLDEAGEYWSRAEPMFAGIGEFRHALQVRKNHALIELDQGYYDSAIAVFQSVIDELPAGADPVLQANVLDDLATAQREIGSVDDALSGFSAALELHRQAGDRNGEAYALRGIGTAYLAAGELDLAEDFLRQALPLALEIQDGRNQARILTSLGEIAYGTADFQEALNLHQSALRLSNSLPDAAYRRTLIARDLRALGRFSEAIDYAELARATAADVGQLITLADALNELGRSELGRGEPETALPLLDEAQQIYGSIGHRSGQAEAFEGIARAAAASGDLEAALAASTRALDQARSLGRDAVTPALRAFALGQRRSYYETHIELLMRLHAAERGASGRYVQRALETSEQGRAQLSLELLTEAANDRYGLPDSDLNEEQRASYRELAAKRYQRDEILRRGLTDAASRAEFDKLMGELSALENSLNLIDIGRRDADTLYARLMAASALDTPGIQALLDDDSVLIEYSLGDERSWVWVVGPDSIDATELAGRSTIEAAARRAFEELRSPAQGSPAPPTGNQNLSALAALVLDPITDQIAGKRLVVAADGALQYVPFGVLPLATESGRQPLIQSNEVVGVASMSVLAVQRARDFGEAPDRTLAVFADPVFGESDPRLAQEPNRVAELHVSQSDLMLRSSVSQGLARLAATGNEASAIAALVPDDERLVATGFDASREEVGTIDLGRYRYIHFATHGLIDSRYPALSALALSQFDEQGRPQSGFLRLHDIYEMHLNADLVVLSACDTALGREIHGEGLVGLVQGFMYAGARRLIASAWQVSDRATAELMKRFYGHVIEDGMPPAAALRQAQLAIARDPRWRDPYFWGAFTLLGEWD